MKDEIDEEWSDKRQDNELKSERESVWQTHREWGKRHRVVQAHKRLVPNMSRQLDAWPWLDLSAATPPPAFIYIPSMPSHLDAILIPVKRREPQVKSFWKTSTSQSSWEAWLEMRWHRYYWQPSQPSQSFRIDRDLLIQSHITKCQWWDAQRC